MENWQLTLVILGSVFVGSLIPLVIMAVIALYRAGKEIAEIGAQMKRTLTQVETISGRVEVLSRGLNGKETNIADLLTSVGGLARGIDKNMRILNIFSTIIASVGMAVATFVKTRIPTSETNESSAADDTEVPLENEPPRTKDA